MVQEVGRLRAGVLMVQEVGRLRVGVLRRVGQCGQAAHRTLAAQIQQAVERLERNFVDTRQLKVCATCFDLSVSLLRVLEMTITLVPEVFLDSTKPTSEMLLQRLAQVRPPGQGGRAGDAPGEPPRCQPLPPSQLLNQVLNRVTAERNLFDRVVTLWLPGEDPGPRPPHAGLGSLPGQPGVALQPQCPPLCPVGRAGGTRWAPAWALTPSPSLGLESVDHYPILVAVTGILVRLLVHGPAAG